MRQYFRFDENGFYTEPVIANYSEENLMPEDVTDIAPTNGLYKAKWNGEKWVEAAPIPAYDVETQIAIWDYDKKQWCIEAKPAPKLNYEVFMAGLLEGYTNG